MEQRKRFHNEAGKPILEFSVCVFMDVLGFAESQKKSFKKGRGRKELQRFYSVIRRELDQMNEMHADEDDPDRDWELKIFTDNIVLGYPISEDYVNPAGSEIDSAVFDIARYQLGMAREGYFVRGGIAIGPLFMDEYLVYGPALLEAYDLEHHIASYPRIIISARTRKLLERNFRLKESPQQRMLLLDSDGQIFVHYLAVCYGDVEDISFGIDEETIGIHKQHIEKGLREFESNPRVWAKFAWLATYHDRTINEWTNAGILNCKSNHNLSIDPYYNTARHL